MILEKTEEGTEMERLTRTIKVSNTSIVVYTKGKYEDTTAAEMEYEDVRNVMRRLSEYEETGLTPEQIRELKDRDTAKAPDYEGDGYDNKGEMIYDTWICPNCGKHYEVDYDDYDFCPNCGQRLMLEERR